MTHWDSRIAPTLPLPYSGSTFSQPFYLNFNNLMSNTIWTIPFRVQMQSRIMLLTKYPGSEIQSIFRSRSVLTITPRILPSIQQQSGTKATLLLPQEL